MTRHYFNNPDNVDFFRRSSRGMISQLSQERSMPLAISHANREESRNCPIARHGNRPSPPQESDLESTGTQPRRRIAVACGRCRKRKIKCSGDPGTGGGCQNCKTAGAAHNCMFLRVNSENLDVQQPVDWKADWTGSVRTSPAESQYPPATSSADSSLGSTSSTSSRRYVQAPYTHGYTAAPYLATKNQLNALYVNYNDDLLEPYGIQSPPYMLPSQDPLGGGYSPHDSLRTWNPISHSSRTSDGGLFLEQEYPSTYDGTPTSYLPTPMTKIPAITTDGSSFFPQMTSLASSLPSTSSATNRVLPNPERLIPSHTAPLQQGSCNSLSPAAGYSYKTNASWITENGDLNYGQTSNGTVANATSSLMGPPSTKNGPATLQNSINYDSISSSPVQSLGASTTLPPSSTNLPAPVTAQHTFAGSTVPMFPTTNEALLPSHSSSNLYSYSADGTSRRDSQDESSPSDGTLMSGRPYVRIRQPQPQSHNASSFDDMRRSSLELRPQRVHRTSIPSLSSNTRGY